jgi:glycosyltransferase involved in cell wall biosynthesis
VSGGIAVICQHVTRLQKRGHKVHLLSLQKPSPMDWFPNQTVPVVHIEEWKGSLDILVATSWGTAYYLPRITATVKYYFVQSDETRFFPAESLWKHLVSLTYYFGVNYLTEARWIREWLRENFGHSAELIPNGLDQTIFYPAPPLKPRGSIPRILLEGAIALPYKGMAEAFETVAPLDVEVWCVSSLGTPQRGWKCDRFFEQVPMVEMRRIYSSCDILLKLSRVEGFFGPPMEMMACGGVAVVGRVSGYDEYIIDGYNALVVDVDDRKAAREAVIRLTSDVNLRNNLIINGRTTAEKWNWEDSIELLERHFNELLSSPQHWADHTKRSEYDSSLSIAYGILSKRADTHHYITEQDTSVYIPPYALTFGQYLISKPLFWKVSAIVRWFYRCRRKIVSFIKH